MCEHNLVIGQTVGMVYNGACIVCGDLHTLDGLFEYTGDVELGHRFKVLTPAYTCPCGEKIKFIVDCCNRGIAPIDVTQEFLSLPVRSRE